ncbi:MFS transporter [Peribacillus aracenensis]|uniref:MFS transporter n=1 Tax=Peribacillus aracenensis TaxID=2976708 RepID=UPI0021A27678|nr:MFS transporter [Peribacillus sp. BBB004]
MNKKWFILALLFFGWALGNLDRFVMSYAIVDISADLSLKATTQGFVLSSFFLGYAIMQMPGGWLADKFGSRKVITSSMLLLSLFTGLTGAVNSFMMIIVIRFLFGLGEGGFMPASTKAISTVFPEQERSRAQSILLSSGGIIGILTPIFATYLMVSIGWRWMFFLMGGSGILFVILYFFYFKVPHVTTTETGQPLQQTENPLKVVLKIPLLWSLFFSSFAIYTISWGLISWLPSYLSKERGLDLVSIGWIQIIPGIASFVGMLAAGYIMDLMPKGKEKYLGIVITGIMAILTFFMFSASSIVVFIICETVVSLSGAIVIILLNALLLKNIPTAVAGSAMGFVNVGGQLAGFIAPMVIGFIVDKSGSFDLAFWMLIAAAVLCMITISTIRTKKKIERPAFQEAGF